MTGHIILHSFAQRNPGALLKAIPLVGRTQELRAIEVAASAADSCKGSALFVAGEGGIGKTRLVSLAAERLGAKGWKVAVGRAYPVETGIPFAVFADALLPTLRSFEPAALAVLSRGGAAELKSIFPTLEGINVPKVSADDPAEFKARMLWNFSQLLGRLAQKQPLLLILENLQWADESSLELLHFVARHVEKQRVLIVSTYNLAERDSNPVLRSTEQSLIKIKAASRMQLSPLSEREVSELVQKTYGIDEEGAGKFSALLYGWARGNPFFVEEILKEVTATGGVTLVGPGLKWREQLSLPATVRDAIEVRIDRLSAGAREIAALAAVIGNRATFDTFSKIGNMTDGDLVSAIEELQSQRVLHEVDDTNPAEYDFDHPLLQQVLYSGLGSARASVMHSSIATALEEKYSASADAHADELAYHYSRGLSAQAGPKAVKYLRIAGVNALARYANREAVSYLRAALERTDAGSIEMVPKEKLSIVSGLARALQRTGNYQESSLLWSRSRDEADRFGDVASVAAAEHRIGLGSYWSANHADALAHFDAALVKALSAKDDGLAVRTHLARAIVLQDVGDVEKAKQGVEDALAIAERSADNLLLARVHRALMLLYAWTGPKEKARAHGAFALQFAKASGQKMLEWTAHWGMAVLSGLGGDAEGVARHLNAAENLNGVLHSPILPIWTAEISVQYLSGTGEWDKGIEQGERAIDLARTFGQRGLLPRLLVWTALIHLWRGDSDKARPMLQEAWDVSRAGSPRAAGEIPSVVPAHHGIASLHLHTRNFEEAISVGEAGLAIADKAGYAAWALQWLLPVVGEAALYAKQWDKAEAHSKRMRRDAHRLDHSLGLAWADACDGLLVMLRDNDPAAGAILLRKAAENMDALQIPAGAAVLRRHLGRALIDAGDADGARKELKRAHDVLARLGARSELESVREQLRELGARPPVKTISAGAAGLTARELEIARMVAERKSNKEIGTALDISARTVSTHLSNIFVKLEVDSRGALTDFIRDKGL